MGEEGGCYVAGCGVGVVEGLEVRLVGGGGGVGGRSGEVRFDFLGGWLIGFGRVFGDGVRVGTRRASEVVGLKFRQDAGRRLG